MKARSLIGGLLLIGMMVLTFVATPGKASTVAETLTDRCSVQVVIKVPYVDQSPDITPQDVILDRTGAFKNLIKPRGPNRGVEMGSNGFTPWTEMISPVPTNKDRFFRWYCGTSAERSRCPEGTKGITARLGPDRLFQTRCWK